MEIIRIIKDYLERKKLKRLLKRRIIRMSDSKFDLKENQYIINGKVYYDTDIVNGMFDWTVKNFIFRGNDVYLPNVPEPLFGIENTVKHNDLQINNFTQKYGNVSLKYLLYNAFIVGYESGIARAKNDVVDYAEKTINEIVNESDSISKISINNNPTNIVEETIPEIKKEVENELKLKTATVTDEVLESINKETTLSDFDSNEKINDEKHVEELVSNTKYSYDENNKLIVDSNFYKQGTYEKYISMVIETKLNKYGLKIDDIYNNIPSYILAEVLIDIDNADTIDNEQEEIKTVFYDYFKSVQESLTKENTTV